MVELFDRLVELGTGQIQVGWPGQRPEDVDLIRVLKKRHPGVVVETVATVQGAGWKRELDAALRAPSDILALIHPVSPQRLRVLGTDANEMSGRIREAVAYACRHHPHVRFGAVDAFRASEADLFPLLEVAVEAGASVISLSDTTGGAPPDQISRRVGRAASELRVPVDIHCHDDFGLALANTLMARRAGATVLDASILGMGERAGNTALEELVMALELLEEIPTGCRTELLFDLCHVAARLFGREVPDNRQWVGREAFAHRFETHAAAVLSDPTTYETVDPARVGNRRQLPGTAKMVRIVLEQQGLAPDAEVIDTVLAALGGERDLVPEDEMLEAIRATRSGHPSAVVMRPAP